MATQQRGKKTRDDILNTAMHLFSLHGYHSTSTNDIIEAAAISKGAFYYHFKSKEDLALNILDRLQDEIQENILAPILASSQPESIFDVLADSVNDLTGNNTDCHRRLLTRFTLEMSNDESELAQRISQTTDWLSHQIADIVQRSYENRTIKSHLAAQTVADILVAIWYGGACQDKVKSKTLFNALRELLTDGST